MWTPSPPKPPTRTAAAGSVVAGSVVAGSPLDGSRVVYWMLPERTAAVYYRLEPYGTLVLMVLIMMGILGRIMTPVIRPLLSLLLGDGGF